MKTEEWVSLLAMRVEAIDTSQNARRSVAALAAGILVALVFTILVLHVNPRLPRNLGLPKFWVREVFCAALSVIGLVAVMRLARPGLRLGAVPAAALAAIAALWLVAVVTLQRAPPEMRLQLILGATAAICPFLIALIGLPSLVAILWILRGLAPTQHRLAGAAAGFAAGSIGALVYTVHCPELAAPFLGIWYLLGILIPTTFGAWLGPRLLRW